MTAPIQQHRCRLTQALLALEQSIADPSEADLDVLLDNVPVKAVIAALGVGIQLDAEDDVGFSLGHLRYGKIIVLTDIGSGSEEFKKKLQRFLRMYMMPLVDNGHLFSLTVPKLLAEDEQNFVRQVLKHETRT